MKVAIVGAGFAGISTAKYLKQYGHDVTVFEACDDVGGVWSKARRYPGLATQNSKETYSLSDMDMPRHYPTWPAAQQVQDYLDVYTDKHDLRRLMRFGTRVERADPTDNGWEITTKKGSTTETNHFDHLVVATGTFSRGKIPEYAGVDEWKAAGGHICHSSDLGLDPKTIEGKEVLVIGYGKSSCDVANAVSAHAKSTTLVARRLIWKVPRVIRGLPYQYLLLTRLGESLFEYITPSAFEKWFNSGSGRFIRNGMLNSLQWVITGQLKLNRLGLVPEGPFEEIARSTISLSTEGLYKNIEAGKVRVRRDAEILRLAKDAQGEPIAVLKDGSTLPCDLLVCATGFHQDVPFLPVNIQKKFLDENDNFLLHKHILPIGVPNLTFNGYNSSLFCPTSSEAAALWISAHLAGLTHLPPEDEMLEAAKIKLEWLDARSNGKHAHGTNLVPFSLHSIDDTLQDIDLKLGTFTTIRQWLLPVRPRDYACLGAKLGQRIEEANQAQLKN
ncbi:related to Dimethylaniline monooxygenase [N-oxide forming] 3 [Sporisorium scitamineum]|uniref:Related to Dimethylaniline monooxygenase [N-oxide forming] 3 n=1 Tax=Sporisorium scitamineum TaxID=49012 RepID=A0A140KM98_9BASI|nr:related to Dimethylaniline monooxygenase [N-oxide forming] 3 [Sporisorium scitamineum]